MAAERIVAVALTLTPDPTLLPVVKGLVNRLAEQLGMEEAQRMNLQHAVGQACRPLLERRNGRAPGEVRLELSGFRDRLEILVEGTAPEEPADEAESFLLNQLFDRVTVEAEEAGRTRLALVKYLRQGRSQS
ncbi:MAG: hypothetical protein ACE5HB_06970 [Terriglobia bacterium]